MPPVFIPQLQSIVIKGCHGPVVTTQDTLIVICQLLSANSGKQTIFGMKFGPCLIEVEVSTTLSTPHTLVLCCHFQGQMFPFIAQRDSGTVRDESRAVLVLLFRVTRQTTLAYFSTRHQLCVQSERIRFLFYLLLRFHAPGQKQQCNN